MPDGSHISRPLFHHLTLSDGQRMRMHYKILKPTEPRGTVVLGPGRSLSADAYRAISRDFMDRDLQVIIPVWLGQEYSDRFPKGKKRHNDYVPTFDHHVEALDSFYEEVVTRRQIGPVIFYGHSMGALNMTLWLANQRNPAKKVDAAIFVSPMFDYTMPHLRRTFAEVVAKTLGRERKNTKPTRISPPRYARTVIRIYNALGLEQNIAWGQKKDPREQSFAGNILTNDKMEFEYVKELLKQNPESLTFGTTWGWHRAARAAIASLYEPNRFDNFNVSTLVLSGGKDPLTPAELVKPLTELMGAQHEIVDGAKHNITHEALKNRGWQYIEPFLNKVLSDKLAA
jgi:alpha-beta hydrolase superfamily lysophospholipase